MSNNVRFGARPRDEDGWNKNFWGYRMQLVFRHMRADGSNKGNVQTSNVPASDDPPGQQDKLKAVIPTKPVDLPLDDAEYDLMRRALIRQTNPSAIEQAYAHAIEVAQWCVRVAKKRELDVHEACMAGFLHDIYFYATGLRPLHAQNSAEQARVLLNSYDGMDADAKARVLRAILHHDEPDVTNDSLTELMKDAHVLSDYTGSKRMVRKKQLKRLTRLVPEWKLIEPQRSQVQNTPDPSYQGNRSALAEVAQTLAAQRICWYKDEPDAMMIAKYWPEETAFDELQGKWCAAFVYHCCYEAGFHLPICAPNVGERLCSVKAWLDFASSLVNGFYHPKSESGFLPERGDIVIFDRILEDKLPADHMGVVIMTAPDRITVAEGNARSSNVSDVIEHSATHHVRGYIRLPNEYRSDIPRNI